MEGGAQRGKGGMTARLTGAASRSRRAPSGYGLVAKPRGIASGGAGDESAVLVDGANPVGQIGEVVRDAKVGVEQPGQPAGREPRIAVAAGLADHRQRDPDPRSRDEAVGHGLLEAEVRPASIADRGDPRPERRGQVPNRLEEP